MISSPPPDESPEAGRLRGDIFTDLDRLAFALEMEASELVRSGLEEEARRRHDMRLGVRLAQRLVTGVHAEEVDKRIDRFAEDYESRLSGLSL